MSNSAETKPCDCCADAPAAPKLSNPPGQTALDYRISTYGGFMRRMTAQLGRVEVDGSRPLRDLTTRAADDFAMGVLDAWAVVGDVLTFYQERIANEGFLRTATERLSVLTLARAIGYELKPGVSAETYLAFTLDDSGSTPSSAPIPAATQVQSLPQKQDELPQTFETTADFTAHVAWNKLQPQVTLPQLITAATTTIIVVGVDANLRTGDRLLLVDPSKEGGKSGDKWDVRRVLSTTAEPTKNRTLVTVTAGSKDTLSTTPNVYALRQRAGIFGHNAADWNGLSADIQNNYPGGNSSLTEWPNFEICVPTGSFGKVKLNIEPIKGIDQIAFEALAIKDKAIDVQIINKPGTTPAAKAKAVGSAGCKVDLDSRYDKIAPNSWIYFQAGALSELYWVTNVEETSRSQFLISAEVTRLSLDGPDRDDFSTLVRQTKVYGAPEKLTLAAQDLTTAIIGPVIDLETVVEPLPTGSHLIVSGIPVGATTAVSEVAELKEAQQLGARTRLTLVNALGHSYQRSTTTIYGNVVHATHGETVADEVLGAGNGAQPHQRFTLKKRPLTHVSAATPAGSRSELTVRVNGVAWEQRPSLYAHAPTDKVYSVRIDDDANATVIFGDGKMGARLPSGTENVRATYRSGIGLDGEVGAGTLTLLKKRPFGVRDVTNPVSADGAEDPETLDGARDNAPLTVRTLDRIVSLRDYEDFARGFAGIGKAQAVALWDGMRELVHITLSDPTGQPVPAGTLDDLKTAVAEARDPLRTVCYGSHEARSFRVTAKVLIDEAYLRNDVEAAITALLLQAFSFEKRAFGQVVTSAEILALIHTIPGVIAVDLEALHTDLQPTGSLNSVLAARRATYDPTVAATAVCGRIAPAQLLLINPTGITLLEMTP
ncbi:MAG: putative baseplate assembly protein [Anaerolineae bacterium]|nr:putative baseplate assembly protein [Anaerolineae bacterium]